MLLWWVRRFDQVETQTKEDLTTEGDKTNQRMPLECTAQLVLYVCLINVFSPYCCVRERFASYFAPFVKAILVAKGGKLAGGGLSLN